MKLINLALLVLIVINNNYLSFLIFVLSGTSSWRQRKSVQANQILGYLWSRCSGKFVSLENYSHVQQYGLGLRLRIGLNLGLGLGLRLGLALVTL